MESIAEFTHGKTYKTVYADPPWPEYGGGKIKRGADRHYTLLSIEEILEIMKGIPCDANSHLWLWTTNNYLPKALYVMENLGFRYVNNIVWVKWNGGLQLGLGQYLRGAHELLLFGIRGKPPFKNQINDKRAICDTPSVMLEPRVKHSKKPDRAYAIIEKISYWPFIEVFARNRRDKWDSWGNEVSGEAPKIEAWSFEQEGLK